MQAVYKQVCRVIQRRDKGGVVAVRTRTRNRSDVEVGSDEMVKDRELMV
jgi:hypothetical protein